MSDLPAAGRDLLLALADDELCVGQNHAWWIAVGPFLEEDLAFVSIAQDELGHARAIYELLAPGAADDLAYGRQPAEYRSAELSEVACHEWSHALVRHLLYDLAEAERWGALTSSSNRQVAELARQALAEESFHAAHAIPLVQRLLASAEGRSHLEPVFGELVPIACGLFTLDTDTSDLVSSEFMSVSLADQESRWRSRVDEVVGDWITIDWPTAGPTSGRGQRSADFAALHHEMIEVREIDPAADW